MKKGCYFLSAVVLLLVLSFIFVGEKVAQAQKTEEIEIALQAS
jgi:hypothetical protein